MVEKIYTVKEINRKVKLILEKNIELNNFFLIGEASNITYYRSGHLYFTLKDDNAAVKCAAFNYNMKNISEDIKEGDLLKIYGSVTLYESNGTYQIKVDYVEKQNKLGGLYEKYEKLKKELSEKGYFDNERKKKLPFLPLNIGIVTSDTGAAIRDIINTAQKRFNNINIYLYPAKVQGEGAENEIAEGISVLDSIDFIDVVIIGRGGGSIEDLWAFNTKITAEAVYQCKKPIISAVGHETDFLISDFVADVRAATPTQAIEILVPEKNKLNEKLYEKKIKLNKILNDKIKLRKEKLKNRKNSYIIKNFINTMLDKKQNLLQRESKLDFLIKACMENKKHKLEIYKNKIEGLNPNKIFQKGYTLTLVNGKNINKIEKIDENNEIITIYNKGNIKSKVIKEMKNE